MLRAANFVAMATMLAMMMNASTVFGAPMPQSDGTSAGDSTGTNLTDPFINPAIDDYPTTFTWESALYGVLFIFFGLIEVIHGYKYIRITMLIAGFLVWASTAVMIMIIVDSANDSYQNSGVYFAVWFAVGLVGAATSFYLWHVGIILVGAYAAFAVVAVLFTAVNLTNYVVRYTALAIVIVAAGYFTKKYERIAVILATSLGGSYAILYGLDYFVQAGFRTTTHIILSQSTTKFQPVVGTWIMIGCLPVITILGIIYELRHHEEPVGSWWFGGGARPLPPLPGEKKRRCCGLFAVAEPKKAVDEKDPETGAVAVVAVPAPATTSLSSSSPAAGTVATSPSSATTVVPKVSLGVRIKSALCCCCVARDKSVDKGKGTSTLPATTATSATTAAAAAAGGVGSKADLSKLTPPTTPAPAATTPPTNKKHKLFISKQVREYQVEVEEQW